jgi:hypothetical protein
MEVFNLIPTAKKELYVTPTVKHMELYSDRTSLELAAERCGSWLAGRLAGTPAPSPAAA